MGNLRCACVVVVLVWLGACGPPAAPAYPTAKCAAAGKCGRVATLGYLGSGPGGEFFVDFDKKDANGSPFVQRITCNRCPFVVGRTYRARMTSDDPERVFSILWYGGEIGDGIIGGGTERPDGLSISYDETWKCDKDGQVPPRSHWVMNAEGWPTCELGDQDPIAWVEDTFPDIPGCGRGFSRGLEFSGVSQLAILIRLSSAYDLADPQLAHDMFPQVFVAALNTRDVHRDSGLADGWGTDWVNADGPPHYYFDVTFQMDSTGDHYGMTVAVSGAPNQSALMSGGDTVPLFTYTIPAVYSTAEELTRASANAAYERLWFGWTCDVDGSHPQQTLEQSCAKFEADRQANTSGNPGYYDGLTCGS